MKKEAKNFSRGLPALAGGPLKKGLEVMGVKISRVNLALVFDTVQKTVNQKGRLLIATPNPEIILASLTDRDFKNTLNSFDLNIADGVGLLAYHRFMRLPRMKFKLLRYLVYLVEGLLAGLSLLWPKGSLTIIKGRMLARKLLKLANDNQWKVYFLGDKTALSAKRILSKQYPKSDIRAAVGAMYDQNAKPVNNKEYKKDINITKDIKKFSPDILLVGFGAPKQERWIVKNARKTGAGVIMGVGGTFSRLSTPTLLGPFEWLWRLITGSNSIKRILSATVVFPWKSYLYKVKYG